jgi:hypothetical protein
MEEGSDSNGIVETTGGNLSPEAWANVHIEELERPMTQVQVERNDIVFSPIETTTVDEDMNSVSGEAKATGVAANSDSSDDDEENNANELVNLKRDSGSSDDEEENNPKQPVNLKGDNELDDEGDEPYVPNNDESESEDGETSLIASPTKSRNELKKETLKIRSKILSK